MTELKPCPFCGGKAKLMDAPDVWVECTSCGAQSRMCAMPETALERWNVRVTEEEFARLENIALGTLIHLAMAMLLGCSAGALVISLLGAMA